MSTVDKVIFDALAKRQNVVLPGVGSLEVKRRKAKKVSETRIIPPQNVVVFTPEEIAEGESVVYLLAATGGANEEEANTLYQSWLENARSGKGVNIKDAGEIADGKFVIAQPLHIALNPAKEEEIIVMEKERNGGPIWLWVLGGILLAAVALILCSYFGNGFLGIQKKPKAVEVVAPVVEPVVEETVAEDVIIENLKQSAPQHRFHVIAGSFSIEKNADNYVKKIQREHPELTVEKIVNPRNGYWMVSIFSAPTERQAYNKLNMYWDIDLDIWVYEEK